MNKQEAIKEIDGYAVISTFVPKSTEVIKIEKAKEIISQIHEPQKVVVPKFVAEWIDTLDEHGLFGLNYDNVSKPVWDWVYENYNCNVKKLHLAYLYGYEVEKERLYTVEIPNPNDDESIIFCLGKDDETGKIVIDSIFEMEELKGAWKEDNDIYHLTEAEIKQDFEWAWQFAKEVE